MNARPFLVRVILGSPWVEGAYPLHLDGLLEFGALYRTRKLGPINRETPIDDLPSVDLPVVRIEHAGDRIYACSAGAALAATLPAIVQLTRRRDTEDWHHLRSPVEVASGPQKNVRLRVGARLDRVVQWFGYGDIEQCRELLEIVWGPQEAPHGQIGHMRRTGSGQILSWEIESAHHSIEECLVAPDKRIRRHVPLSWWRNCQAPARGACRAPYWHPDRITLVARYATIGTLEPVIAAKILTLQETYDASL